MIQITRLSHETCDFSADPLFITQIVWTRIYQPSKGIQLDVDTKYHHRRTMLNIDQPTDVVLILLISVFWVS